MEMSQAIMLLICMHWLVVRNVHRNWFVKYLILNIKTNPTDFAEMMIADRCLLVYA